MTSIPRRNLNPSSTHYTLLPEYILLLEPDLTKNRCVLTLNHSSSPAHSTILGSFHLSVANCNTTAFRQIPSSQPTSLVTNASKQGLSRSRSISEHTTVSTTSPKSTANRRVLQEQSPAQFIRSLPPTWKIKDSRELRRLNDQILKTARTPQSARQTQQTAFSTEPTQQ